MEIVLTLLRDGANTDLPTKVTIVGSGESITLSLQNPDRMITFDTVELALAIDALARKP